MASKEQRVVTVDVAAVETARVRLAGAFQGHGQAPRITFASADLMRRILTPQRLELLQAMAGHGAMPVQAVALLVNRKVKDVQEDVQVLLAVGVLQPCDGKEVIFPYDGLCLDDAEGDG